MCLVISPVHLARKAVALGDKVTFKVGTQVVGEAPWVSSTNIRLDFHPPEAVTGGPYNGLVALDQFPWPCQ